jgi:UDP-N-acetylmuramoyl-tripeptide--D-alanyl-D-alanine ligase
VLGLSTGWRNPLKWLQNIIKGFALIIFPYKYPQWLVLEVGIRKPGDMEKLKRWVKPNIVVVSAFGSMPSHVEFFEDKYGVWAEEASIIDALPHDGILLLNHDDPEVFKLADTSKTRYYSFGIHDDATLKISSRKIDYHPEHKQAQGTIFRVDYDGKSVPVHVHGFLGNNVVYAASAALLVAHVLKLPMVQAIKGLAEGEFPSGRMRVIAGVKNTLIIDDTYNSSPSALYNSIDVLFAVKSKGRKIAVLGDMLDLGKHTDSEHKQAGEYIVGRADILVAVGLRSRNTALAAAEAGMNPKNIHTFDDSQEAGKFVEMMIKEGDVILVKGSQGARMERAVLEMMAYPLERENLLVRQEESWVEKE